MTYLIDEVRERKVIGRTVNYIGGKKLLELETLIYSTSGGR